MSAALSVALDDAAAFGFVSPEGAAAVRFEEQRSRWYDRATAPATLDAGPRDADGREVG